MRTLRLVGMWLGLGVASGLGFGVRGQAERPSFPEGDPTPRYSTEVELRWMAEHPLTPGEVTPPPAGPVRCPAEYEPMEGLLFAWENAWTGLIAQMARELTTRGEGIAFVVVDTAGEGDTVWSALEAAGCDMSLVRLVERTTDTIWIRDYGPRYVYQGGVRAVIDHTYNRVRPNDNAFNRFFGPWRGHAVYELGLIHGGGNFHLDAIGRSYATRLIADENPGLSEAEIVAIWRAYQRVETTLTDAFPRDVDFTQHIDMWVQVVDDDRVIVSDWPEDEGSTQDRICDETAAMLEARGCTVVRVPARSLNGVHYTYTNMVICNGVVFVPTYQHAEVAQYNDEALWTIAAALPGREIVPLDCESIIRAAGALHCISMHVPAAQGGVTPTCYLIGPRGGQVFSPGDAVRIEWASDDDVGTIAADVLLSLDGGATFDVEIASGIADAGALEWAVPDDLRSATARVRVVVRDADGRSGADEGAADFTITRCWADVNADDRLDIRDFFAFQALAAAGDARADCDGTGTVDVRDFFCFQAMFAAGCP